MSHTVKKPDFYTEEKGLSASEIGTAVHTVLEHMDFSKEYDYLKIKELIKECKEIGLLTEKEASSVSIKKIETFAKSQLYRRILKAEAVYKEEAFTAAVTPEQIYKRKEYADMDENIILHGRIAVSYTHLAAVTAELKKNPDSVNLKRQAVLLNHADIMTIHSFCLSVARENYNRLGIDPAFRVADETETLLIKAEILDRLFEEKYGSDEPEDFFYLV